jgi:hypothetical protein
MRGLRRRSRPGTDGTADQSSDPRALARTSGDCNNNNFVQQLGRELLGQLTLAAKGAHLVMSLGPVAEHTGTASRGDASVETDSPGSRALPPACNCNARIRRHEAPSPAISSDGIP